ncbi:type II toxin-antitoxin system antitoxin SocA domain-containing protein [Endozoicomonas sp. 4G]|uniref:Panacea domain-containing protein n=1 Tax=Endozoicomonas sp. 4G TaxID=2872754 RepID=UPI002078D460|nr:type II toxin-antitoxin system antitoxin SocA domain-containing protein [Endozoicomonas sp. 4G]
MAHVKDVAEYFLYLDDQNDGDGISNLKLQKLIYYAQGFYSAIFGSALFDSSIVAWTHGPVVTDLYHEYKHYGKSRIPEPRNIDHKKLNSNETEIIEEVFEVFGQFTAWKLRNMTHEESPWLNHADSVDEIPLSEMTDYFKTRIQ